MVSFKNLSLTSALWICVIIGGVAVSLISGQTNNTTPDNSDNTTFTAPSEVTSPADSNSTVTGSTEAPGNDSSTVAPQSTPFSNDTTEPPLNTTTNPNATTENPPTGSSSEMTSPLSSPTSPSTSPKTTSRPNGDSGRKFDVASFFGGVATAVGVTIIIFVIVRCYTNSKKTSYHAM